MSSQSEHKLAPPDRFGIEEPRAYTLDELLGGHGYAGVVEVADGHDEDIASGDTCASKCSTRDMMRHSGLDGQAVRGPFEKFSDDVSSRARLEIRRWGQR